VIEVLRLLHEVSQDTSRYSSTYYVRHLFEGEPIPLTAETGIPDSKLAQREWIWVAYSHSNDEPLAILIAAPMQGVVTFMRLFAKEGSSPSILVGLLRKSLADSYSRGYIAYSVFLDEKNNPKGAQLLRIALKAGAKKIDGAFSLVYGSTDIGRM